MAENKRTIYTTVWVSGKNIGSTFASSPEDDPTAPRTPVLYPDLTDDEREEIVSALDAMARFYAQFSRRKETGSDRSP